MGTNYVRVIDLSDVRVMGAPFRKDTNYVPRRERAARYQLEPIKA